MITNVYQYLNMYIANSNKQKYTCVDTFQIYTYRQLLGSEWQTIHELQDCVAGKMVQKVIKAT